MIKYLGSKRRLLPTLVSLATSAGARTALDLFSGTARVARGFKQSGLEVTAVDSATYAHVLAQTYIALDAEAVDSGELTDAVRALNELPGRPGYVTDVFCEQARYFHPDNGARIDAIRDEIESRYAGTKLYPVLLTSLLEAADRVDSTTGVQMAYLKAWAARALRPLELRVPELIAGPGRAILGDAEQVLGVAARTGTDGATSPEIAEAAQTAVRPALIGHFDVAYLDPPYNQHRYFTNYHVWETLVRWDAPEHYGIACKRIDARDEATASAFNRRRQMPAALGRVLEHVDADLLLVSYNDESWLSHGELVALCEKAGSALSGTGSDRGAPAPACVHTGRPSPSPQKAMAIVGIDQPRYVGARIGIHNPSGERVGTVSHLRNTELVVIAGRPEVVRVAVAAALATAKAGGLSARELSRSGA